MGSKLARSAWGTKRSVRAAARCEIAGVANEPATDSAPTPAIDLRNALRSIVGLLRCPDALPDALESKLRAELRLIPNQKRLFVLPKKEAFPPNGINKRPVFNARDVAPARGGTIPGRRV